MRILHVASHVINVGDGALNGVIQDRLRALSGVAIDFALHDVVVDRRELTVEDLEAFDLVVVGGGGAISDSPANGGCGTALPASMETLRASRVPFTFVGIGQNLFVGDTFPYPQTLSDLLGWCAERGHPFSTRNDGSLERLSLIVDPSTLTGVVEVPDPGYFFAAAPRVPDTCGSTRYAIIQFAADRPDARFGVDRRSRLRRAGSRVRPNEHLDAAVDDIAAFARGLVDQYEMEVVFAPHVPADVVMVGQLMERLPAGVSSRYASRPFRTMGLPHPRSATEFFGAYAAADLVVGMRGHAVICGVGLGAPVIALSTHPKVAGFMGSCDLEPWVVEPGRGLEAKLSDCAADVLGAGRVAYDQRRRDATTTFSAQFDALLLDSLMHAGVRA